jgi:aminotransferase in exopolysaccharide biosynthesis
MFDALIGFIRDIYGTKDLIPLHAPVFRGQERAFVLECIESSYVSSVGPFVDRFERDISTYTGAPCAVATVNGTAALHVALLVAGVERGDLVITQALTFVATCNAIMYCGAEPVFVDVDRHTLGLSPRAVEQWLDSETLLDADGVCRHKKDGRIVRACLPMHTFGHPVELAGFVDLCKRWNLALVEDAAESLGSLYNGQHTGTFGCLGALSFNGNKILTTGGGGMLLTDAKLGARARYLTTTAKRPHAYEFIHDEVGYNYRLPNINAALGCAQLEQIETFVQAKRQLAASYAEQLSTTDLQFVREPPACRSNYWLNAVICEDRAQRDALLSATHHAGVSTRPIWKLMNHLPAFRDCVRGDLVNSEWLETRVVNLPSSVVTSSDAD